MLLLDCQTHLFGMRWGVWALIQCSWRQSDAYACPCDCLFYLLTGRDWCKIPDSGSLLWYLESSTWQAKAGNRASRLVRERCLHTSGSTACCQMQQLPCICSLPCLQWGLNQDCTSRSMVANSPIIACVSHFILLPRITESQSHNLFTGSSLSMESFICTVEQALRGQTRN